jgi:hypothetical protein
VWKIIIESARVDRIISAQTSGDRRLVAVCMLQFKQKIMALRAHTLILQLHQNVQENELVTLQ